MIRVLLPYHLSNLAKVPREVEVEVAPPVTIGALLEAIEQRWPVLRGTIREHETLKRRPMVRFFACEQDWSHEPYETPVPETVARGQEPFMIVGAMAGG